MKLPIVLSILLSTFATSVPNLCDDVYVDAAGDPITDAVGQTLARFCVWTGPDAPVWDADVCCTFDDDGAACSSVPQAGRCPTDTKRRYCERGAADPAGGVTCYQPFPDACEVGNCVQAPDVMPPPSEFLMCCSAGGACQHVEHGQGFDCNGTLQACDYGIIDGNGVVECWG